MYPYKLTQNPYHSSPTPRMIDSRILGGKRHKEAKMAVLACIDNLYSKIHKESAHNDSGLITIIQDVGSGKTHLALHIKGLEELSETSVISYIDVSQISPRNIQSLYNAILGGLSDDDIDELRRSIVFYLADNAERGIKGAKKIFRYGFFDSMRGKSIKSKAQQVLEKEVVPDYAAALQVLKSSFTPIEANIARMVIEGRIRDDAYNVETLEDTVASVAALAILNMRFLKKITIFQVDEFDSDKESTDLIKAIINAHLPASIITLILTPSAYEDIRAKNGSLFDRLEKANYKIDLAGSNTFEEINDIVLEYIRRYDNQGNFTDKDERDLISKIKVIYDEFPDFRNVRSIINIFYHATEAAQKRNSITIDEEAIDDTIKSIYPGLRIRGSIMSIPVSDFIKIRKNCADIQDFEANVRDAIRDLVNCAHDTGSVAELEAIDRNNNGIDVIYNDPSGSKVAVAVVIGKDHAKNFQQIADTVKTSSFVDKLLILTNSYANGIGNGTTVVNIDRSKMIDLIYFSSKYKRNEIVEDEMKRALLLARSIKLC